MIRLSTALSVIIVLALLGCTPAETTDAHRGEPIRTRVDRRPWTGHGLSGAQLLTDNYRIFTTSDRRAIEQYLPGFMEAAYGRYLELTGLPDRPRSERMPMYVMGTRDEWAALTKSVVPPEQLNTYLAIRAGGYCYEGVCVMWDLGGMRTFPIATHEGLHQFFEHRLEHPIPLWLEEGLCVLAEGHRIDDRIVIFDSRENHERFQALREAIVRGDWIPLKELLPMEAGGAVGHAPGKAEGYYGQLWALAMFIRSEPEYREGLERMLADAEAGRLHTALEMEEAEFEQLLQRRGLYNRRLSKPLFRRYICEDIEGFERQYYAFAREAAKLN